ncbi:MAG TPA: SDR family NAD(P)-dependent oxidoreductase [Steroidobacteraceae bacterium]|jgi:NAD(P)-dependent dehydrogenase (short-subunit alcohol dehydrogenase family)
MMQAKTALVTGSTDGLGREVALRLGRAGFRVLVHGRDAQRGEAVVAEIAAAGGAARFLAADFSSLAAVRSLAQSVVADSPRLTLLIVNAGIGTGGRGARRATSIEGLELTLAVNYLAGFLLTEQLLPALEAGAPARIVNVASAGQYPLDFDNLMLTRAYSGMRAYAQSKLAQVMYTFDLAERLRDTGVTVNCLHPATYMDTNMVRTAGATPVSTVAQGADAVMQLATSGSLPVATGGYFDGKELARAHDQAYDSTARARLRVLSLELTGMSHEQSQPGSDESADRAG